MEINFAERYSQSKILPTVSLEKCAPQIAKLRSPYFLLSRMNPGTVSSTIKKNIDGERYSFEKYRQRKFRDTESPHTCHMLRSENRDLRISSIQRYTESSESLQLSHASLDSRNSRPNHVESNSIREGERKKERKRKTTYQETDIIPQTERRSSETSEWTTTRSTIIVYT